MGLAWFHIKLTRIANTLPIGVNLSHRWLIARLTYPPWNEFQGS
ncbi:hypothetical protein Cal7507_5421 [Calothrix sp. PCC 7507]|nr:hypothetical protein Cal7507_5421 [Calothrix sp. PCC 7507]